MGVLSDTLVESALNPNPSPPESDSLGMQFNSPMLSLFTWKRRQCICPK